MRPLIGIAFALLFAAAAFLTFPVSPAHSGSYFTPADSAMAAAAGWTVIMQTAPPANDSINETTFAYFPLTDASTQNIASIKNSTWSGRRWASLWSSRRNTDESHNNKANPIFPAILVSSGKQCRAWYSSVAKANAAVKVRLMRLIGYTQEQYELVAIMAGIEPSSIYSRADIAAQPDAYCATPSQDGEYMVMIDKVWLSDDTLVGATFAGVVLDYEVQDSRSSCETLSFLLDVASLLRAKGKLSILYTNPLTGPTMPYTGLDETNLPAIHDGFDHIVLLTSSNAADAAADFAAQFAKLGAANYDKIISLIDIAITIDEAHAMRGALVNAGVKRVMFWANGQAIGAPAANDDVNLKINAIVFGATP